MFLLEVMEWMIDWLNDLAKSGLFVVTVATTTPELEYWYGKKTFLKLFWKMLTLPVLEEAVK